MNQKIILKIQEWLTSAGYLKDVFTYDKKMDGYKCTIDNNTSFELFLRPKDCQLYIRIKKEMLLIISSKSIKTFFKQLNSKMSID